MDRVLSILRRLAKLPGFRRLTRSQFLMRFAAATRASLVRERLRFAFNELRLRPTIGTYHVAGSGVAVCVRHHTPDWATLDELFSQRLCEPPPEVRRILDGLARPAVVVDLGANIGLFGAFALGLYPSCKITAFEPDRLNAAVLERCIAANHCEDRWTLVRACAATQAGRVPFHYGQFATSQISKASAGPNVEEVRALDVFPYLESADLLKMDIEGSEWPILEDSRFPNIHAAAIVLEYHGETCPSPDARMTAEMLLERAGYSVRHLFHDEELDVGMYWGWRAR